MEEKLRVWYLILGTDLYYQEVKTLEEAKLVIDSIARFLNTKIEEGVFEDHCSAAGLQYYDTEEGIWLDWYDENGLDFDDHFEALEEGEE